MSLSRRVTLASAAALLLQFGRLPLALAKGEIPPGFEKYPQTTLVPTTEFGRWIDSAYKTIAYWEAGIFAVVAIGMLVTIIRFRARPGHVAQQDMHGHTMLELGWTILPAVILGFIAVPTVRTIFRSQAPAVASALQVKVVGHQWWWEFQYPTLGITTANEIHLPVGQTVNFELHSADVIHSFWFPGFGGKRDLIPGHPNKIWWTPEVTGLFRGQCAEFCGTSHANMRMRAFVDTPADFQAWVAAQQAMPDSAKITPDVAAGAKTFASSACVGCHAIKGVSAGVLGPNLTHVGSRTTIAGGIMENTPENVAKWLKNPPHEKPGSLMPVLGLSDDQIRGLVAYMESLK